MATVTLEDFQQESPERIADLEESMESLREQFSEPEDALDELQEKEPETWDLLHTALGRNAVMHRRKRYPN